MSKARQLANLGNVYDDGALSNRNRIINGGFDVWQRGTSFTPSSVIFGADRFAAYKSGASAGDYARSTDVPAGQGFTYSGYFNGTDIRHSIELPAAGKRGVFVDGSQWTLSFWVKAAASGTATANLGWANGVSASSLTYWGADQSYSYSTSWEKKTITFTVGGSITGSHAAVLLYMSSVSGLYLTGVMLEIGDTATPFEYRSYGDELQACQRYYQRWSSDGAQPYFSTGRNHSGTVSIFTVNYRTEMRGRPSLSISAAADIKVYDGYDRTCTGVTLNGNALNTCGFNVNGLSSGVGNNYAAMAYFISTSGYFALDAEL